MKLFTALTQSDVQKLRRKPMSVEDGKHLVYKYNSHDIENAIKHLQTLYTGNVRASFAAKILLLNELY